ncbi:MAG: FAD-dependent oxidoreductase [Candidatus Solibacter sp.]|nr:FAD-dependent oxidoreductase [Candidatus Solibacter sp.]
MITSGPCNGRRPQELSLETDLLVAGGGLAGTCAAVTAARAGIRVVLIQDRPVLGGNASSEVRLWTLGATSHMGNNNRWAREGGVIDEILVENLHRNPEGNPLILDTILLEKVVEESNIQLLLNTAVHDLEMAAPGVISEVRAWCSQNSTAYLVKAPLFCDASGDGVLGFLAGAAFRMGAESRDEFAEGFAPEAAYGELLGHSLYFYSKDTGRPVKFTAPSFALKDITQIPRYRDIKGTDSGCRFWWLEYGGRLDTVHETEAIKWELWKVAYGVWDYIKNSGKFPEADTMTLEWVGTIPGKRESRRFEGDYVLTQRDLVEQRQHADAVGFGGWAMDLHPADGLYSPLSPCTQWHSKGVYQIPYRTMYSRNVANLFLTGRLISVSHVAFGSTRVMATCAHNGQAVGMAAALCLRHGVRPRAVPVAELQRELLRAGQHIPGLTLHDSDDLARTATVRTSSCFELEDLPPCSDVQPLDVSRAMLLPVLAGKAPALTVLVDVERPTTLEVEVRSSCRPANFTPEITLHRQSIELSPGRTQSVRIAGDISIDWPRYLAYCLLKNDDVSVYLSDLRVTGVLSLAQSMNKAVAKGTRQEPPKDSGIDSFEFWLPSRRPGGKNLAASVEPPLRGFCGANVTNGVARPVLQPNAWVAAPDDPAPSISLCWREPQTVARIELAFDTDFDHPMESVLMGHLERDMPFCVRHYRIRDSAGTLLYECADNHQTRNSIRLPAPVSTTELRVEVLETHGAPAAIFEIRCYA